jgi:adenylate cyclase
MNAAGEGGWEKRRRVVVFCDISGFMRLAASLGGRLPEFVQEYYEMAGDAVAASGGRLVKYIGDAVLSVFPEGREREAMRCALRMRAGFGELLGKYAPVDGARLEIAVSSGEVAEGVCGHRSLRMYDVMGDAVAHAAVLNRLPGIVVTTEVRRVLGPLYRVEKMPSVPLKWSADALEAWRVLEE